MKLVEQVKSWWKGFCNSVRQESQRWHIVCTECGKKKSVWESGGVRWKAAGNSHKLVYCSGCQKMVWAKMEYLPESSVGNASPTLETTLEEPSAASSPKESQSPATAGIRLWIDGVGCWRLLTADTIHIGGGANSESALADIVVQAPLSRSHVLIERFGEDYSLTAKAPTKINDVPASSEVHLPACSDLQLGDVVQLRLEVPNQLSRSARLTCTSGHRFVDQSDGLILVKDHLFLGPSAGAHIHCPAWPAQLVLFVRSGELFCQGGDQLRINGEAMSAAHAMQHGDVISGQDLRIRVEIES
ncbi:MAG: FHA domain-containing protein [Planctomycetaceae bacterium]